MARATFEGRHGGKPVLVSDNGEKGVDFCTETCKGRFYTEVISGCLQWDLVTEKLCTVGVHVSISYSVTWDGGHVECS